MLVKGDKIVLKEKMGMFDNIGEVCDVLDVTENGVITFRFGGGLHMGCMSMDEFEIYFDKYEEQKKKNTVTEEDINRIVQESQFRYTTQFEKCTVAICKLPNGFVITESSSCVDTENYDPEIGKDICLKKIRDKIWELEGYRLQCELYEKNKASTYENAEVKPCPSGGCKICREMECKPLEHDCNHCSICKDNGGCCKGCD